MLSATDNERLARIGPGTEMGALMRRYWIPFLLTEDVPDSDGEPVRVTLLGERLVAFRNSVGQVGLVDRLCAHRNADLFFGRNEENGIRCTYHGWKYDVEGRCTDMPSEASDSNFRDKIQLRAYPVKERGGVLWTYMGPKEHMQPMPEFEWTRVPDDHRYVLLELPGEQLRPGHRRRHRTPSTPSTCTAPWTPIKPSPRLAGQPAGTPATCTKMYRTRENPPKLKALETDFGLIIGGRYPGDETQDYWRFNLFWMPFYTAPRRAAATRR